LKLKMLQLPTHADVVVIGGGIAGCSTAYHLARDYKLNVVLLEQNVLTSGSTWHAAGLVGQLRNSAAITQLLKYSVGLYKDLHAETGLDTGWKMTGCLRLACNEDRWIEFKRLATTARSFGMEMQLLSPAEAQKYFPLMRVDDLIGVSYLPTDGHASPSDITAALVKAGRARGVRVFEGCGVQAFRIAGRQILSAQTTSGEIFAEKFVICGGMWSRQLAAKAGALVPLIPVKHQYVITEKIAGLDKDAPTIRDPDRRTYFKEEVGGLAFGGYEPNPKAWDTDDVPSDHEFRLFDDDWPHFEQHVGEAIARIPAIEKAGIKKMINGAESFTPDGNFILGRAPERHNLYLGCGFNAYGIAAGGGAGWALADWIARGEAPMDLWPVDIRRFSASQCTVDFVRNRTLESYAKHYAVAFPHEEHVQGRGQLKSPLYSILKNRGAVWGSKLGWERANWFAEAGKGATDKYSMGRQNWFEPVAQEHLGVRTAAGLFDQSSFSKFEVIGAKAAKFLSWVCANDVLKPIGSIIYTQMLNARGCIECDVTVMRLAADRFYLVSGTGFRTHDFAWMIDQAGTKFDVTIKDVTEDYSTLVLMGPRSREILSAITTSDISNAAFPFGYIKNIDIDGVQLRSGRITYVGELGYELHLHHAFAEHIFSRIEAAGKPFGLKLCGYRAIESLRLEKGYRAWGTDITSNDTPLEAGLGFALKLKSAKDFIGRKAVIAAMNQPMKKLMTGFMTEREDIILVGRETILRDGQFAGYLTSGGYGHTVKKPIGYGYIRNAGGVDRDYVHSGHYELVVASEIVKATPFFGALFDPKNERVRC
jgi:sarcosine dehydrogenase